MVYTRKTKLYNLPGADILSLTNNLAPDSRGWRQAAQHLDLTLSEVRRCEAAGGAASVVDLMTQRGWSVGKLLDMLEKIGNEEAISALMTIVSAPPVKTQPAIKLDGNFELGEGDELRLKLTIPNSYTDIQWYFEENCLDAEKSNSLVIEQATEENAGRYKVRLQSRSGDVKWVFANVNVLKTRGPFEEDLKFLLHPQDYHIKETASEAHFFVDVRPHAAHLQWYCEGLLMHDKTSPYLCVTGLNQTAHRRQYKCTATHAGLTITSETALIRWKPDVARVFSNHSNHGNRSNTSNTETATDKVALIIGNQSYREAVFSDIVHAEDDARDISSALSKMNFKVVSLINLTRDEMLTACDNFYKLLSGGVYGVFYFAGHGFESAGENYLVPVDAPSQLRIQDCIKAQYVLHRMQFRDTKLNLLLLDMCREYANVSSVPCDIQPVISRGNTAIGFACGAGSRAYGSDNDDNGIYVKYLKEHIARNITVTTLLDSVNKAIGLHEPTGYQRPHYTTSLVRNISLTDPIDTTNHTAEFHHRAIVWGMANTVDKEEEDIILMKERITMKYSAVFSNVLHFSVSTPVESLDIDHDSKASGLILEVLSPTSYNIRNVQKLTQIPFIEVSIIHGCSTGTVRIERPLFAKITANRVQYGGHVVDVLGSNRPGVNCQPPPCRPLKNRGHNTTTEKSQIKLEELERASKEPKHSPSDTELERASKEPKHSPSDTELERASKEPKHSPSDTELERASKEPKHSPSDTEHRPFVGVYFYLTANQSGNVKEIVEMIVSHDKSYRTEQISRVTMETTVLNKQTNQAWIEVILKEQDNGKSKKYEEGTGWCGSKSLYSCHVVALLNMLHTLAVNNGVSEVWITDEDKYRQVHPRKGLVVGVPPYTLPVA